MARLRARWSQGASARQIAKELGGGISRKAVLGKVRRLGLAQPSPYGGARRKRSAAERDRRARKRAPGGRPGGHVGGMHPSPHRSVPAWVSHARSHIDDPLADADIPLSQRRSLLELDRRTCRWPIGNPGSPDFLFCGAEPRKGKPYCAAHCARAYLPEKETTLRAANAGMRPLAFRSSRRRDHIEPIKEGR
jgi:GcrA cell cycle regulator